MNHAAKIAFTERRTIPVEEFNSRAFTLWGQDHLLLNTGSIARGDANTMTVGWGMFGTMWAKPCVMVVVRPQRFSFHLLEEGDSFTLSALPEPYRDALTYCGAHSGSEGDKFRACGLTAVPGRMVEAPVIAQAELNLECRLLYADAFRGKSFRDKSIVRNTYVRGDYHAVYFGEVLVVEGTGKYQL